MVEIRSDYRPTNDELHALNDASWEHEHEHRDYMPILERSLCHICAFDGDDMIGFVNVAWDGGIHAFVLDTCVAPSFRHRGIGSQMVEMSVAVARERGAKWLHVDFEPHLERFYEQCGFRHTNAGLIDLTV